MKYTGNLHKMSVELEEPVGYTLDLGEETLQMNELIGKEISLEYLQHIHCIFFCR